MVHISQKYYQFYTNSQFQIHYARYSVFHDDVCLGIFHKGTVHALHVSHSLVAVIPQLKKQSIKDTATAM